MALMPVCTHLSAHLSRWRGKEAGSYAWRILAAAAVGALALIVSPVSAHAFGQRYDLPIPLNYFLVGAVATVFLSFVLIGLFVQRRSEKFSYPRLDLLRASLKLDMQIGAVMSSQILAVVIRAVSALTLLLLLVVGFFGTDRAIENLSPTFIWIIWWVGMGYVVALVGNVWVFINPWKITFEWYRRLRGFFVKSDEPEDPPFNYPQGLDIWPALLLFFLFAWAENVYTGAFRPFTLSVMALMYSIVTWVGMAAFGKHTWLRNGEAFTVLFGFFSRFSPTELRVTNRGVCRDCASDCRLEAECVDCYDCYEYATAGDRQLNLRPFAVGLALQQRVSVATAAFVVLALATVSFDGFQDTETWANLRANMLSFATSDVVDTVALALAPALFAVVYLAFAWAIKTLSREEAGALEVASVYVFSLVPIALAYNLAHFITLLLIQGQLIVPLASDPFGFGWNIFGTADYRLNLNIIGAKAVWFISLIAIVLGHVISVYLAHVISQRRSSSAADALRGQIPMLALMIIYTATSLWIIAQPIVG